ncbi:GGDEF domain-containing protein [Larsenimonas suaedae]|uniref:diguanylate cyclase n=1 Tax=Larsenimonas suaedae TaxID=1851019 RepID=A0ABU1GSQ9_9GAMM|nr:GGDEF domain-containing protein [Larsenimonas suaedae]MCM2972339.1 GGDEF domain-containing protein [Larsenimonas suaedae]MDR5894865.1 GGDEF domain-containing protein [Larsenimonas suaedae]
MELDITTFHFSSVLSRVGFMIVFAVMIAKSPGTRYLWCWGGAIAASTLGSLIALSVPQNTMPAPTQGAIMFGAYVASMALSWSGLRLFYARPGKLAWALLLIMLTGISYPILPALSGSMALEVALIYALAGMGSALVVVEIYRARHKRLWSQYVVGAAFTSYLLSFLLGLLQIVLSDKVVTMTSAGQGPMIFDQVSSIMVYFGLIAMTSEWANQRLIEQAETDPLTGLINRRGVATRLNATCTSDERVNAVLLLDIDHFKSVNDCYGHDDGDTVLSEFASRLRQTLRDNDLIARWGGEEFLVVLPGVSLETARQRAEAVRLAIAKLPFQLSRGALDVTVSIGVAVSHTLVQQFDTTVNAADAALYQAKHAGRNRVCLSHHALTD